MMERRRFVIQGKEGLETEKAWPVVDHVVWLLREHRFVMHVEPGWLRRRRSSGQGLRR
jgi:hypothetical protein